MFKLSSIRDVESAVVEVLDPRTKAPTGAAITLAGPEHPKAKKIAFANTRRRRKAIEKSGKLSLEDPEAEALRVIEDLVSCTLGWSGFFNDDGTPMEFNEANVRNAYTCTPWLRAQMLEAQSERENFIGGSPTSSSSTPAPGSV